MKITFHWLKQYVDFPWSPSELAERLTMLGLEVESTQKTGGGFDGIVVAQVITRDRHPNADKLSLCRVNDGQGERQIVCGAQNFKAGDKVPLILPGHTLPAKPGDKPLEIKVGKIRGVESHGMLCSPQELGLPDAIDGLLILPENATVGQPFAEYLGRSAPDTVYDLEITPNRPDWNSLIGIAREISALTGHPLHPPEIQFASSQLNNDPIAPLLAVRLDDPELCPRYVARLIRGVKIGPSPAWLRAALEKAGLRSINNVVDVTNFVMLETGPPLHAFDFRLLHSANGAPPTVVVRHAAESEKFKTLDAKEHTLTAQMLLIADETKGIALAGVMGGENTEIKPDTTDVLLESAFFKPQNIRATAKKLDIRTDASYRFERGADIGGCDFASRRAAQLILETAGGSLGANSFDSVFDDLAEARRLLAGLGLTEIQGQTLLSSAAPGSAATPLPLRNPLSADMNVLRSSLLPGLLAALQHNVSRKNGDLALFEIGRVFTSSPPSAGKPHEERRLALALTGRRSPLFWSGPDREARFDTFDLKGVLEEFLEHFGQRGTAWTREQTTDPLFLESAAI